MSSLNSPNISERKNPKHMESYRASPIESMDSSSLSNKVSSLSKNESLTSSQNSFSLPKVNHKNSEKSLGKSSIFFSSAEPKKANSGSSVKLGSSGTTLSPFHKLSKNKNIVIKASGTLVDNVFTFEDLNSEEKSKDKSKDSTPLRTKTPIKELENRKFRASRQLFKEKKKSLYQPPKARETTTSSSDLQLSQIKEELDSNSKTVLENKDLNSEEKLLRLWDIYINKSDLIAKSLLLGDENSSVLQKILNESFDVSKSLLIKMNKENKIVKEKLGGEVTNLKIRLASEQKFHELGVDERDNLNRQIRALKKEVSSLREQMARNENDKYTVNTVFQYDQGDKTTSTNSSKIRGKENIVLLKSGSLSQNDSEICKSFCETGVSTLDLLKVDNKQVGTSGADFQKDSNTQTDLYDIIEDLHDFSLTPVRCHQSKPSPHHLKLSQVDCDDDMFHDGDKAEPHEHHLEKIRKTVGNPLIIRHMGLNTEDWEFLSKESNQVRVGEALAKYTNEMEKFYQELESIFQKVKNQECSDGLLLAITERTSSIKEFTRDVIDFAMKAEDELFFKYLHKNIEVAEHKLEASSEKRIAENWQKRLNKAYQKFQKAQEKFSLEGGPSTSRLEEAGNQSYKNLIAELKREDMEASSNSNGISPSNGKNGSGISPTNGKSGNGISPSNGKTVNGISPLSGSSLRRMSSFNNMSDAMKLQRRKTTNFENFVNEKIDEYTLKKNQNYVDFTKKLMNTKRKIHRNIVGPNVQSASKFFRRLEKLPLIPKEEIKLETLCKLISAVYSEIIKQGNRWRERTNPLFFYLYDYLLSRCGGAHKLAEEKIFSIIKSSLVYKLSHPKINLFLKLLGIIDDDSYEYDAKDLAYYIYSLIELDEDNASHPGLSLSMISKERTMIPLRRAMTYITSEFQKDESLSKNVELNSILQRLKREKENDQQIAGRLIIDTDFVIDLMNSAKIEHIKKLFKNLFDSVLLEDEKYLDLERFLLIWRNIERRNYSFYKAMEIFEQESDVIDEENNQKFMSFRQFTSVAQKHRLFSSEVVPKFYNSVWDETKSIKNLEKNWPTKKIIIKLKLIKIRMYTQTYQKLMKSMDEFFENGLTNEGHRTDVMWMRYRILDDEATFGYLDIEVEKILNAFDPKLIDLNLAYNKHLFRKVL